jgi:hypothetical protein
MSGIRTHNFRSINRKRENDDKKEKNHSGNSKQLTIDDGDIK